MKCALKPLRDERAREMHDDTASRSSCVAAGSVTLHKKKCNKARQNRTFAKRNLERNDCSARSAAQAESVNFCG